MEIISPLDGDMLHAGDGVTEGDLLRTRVTIQAQPDSSIRVNGLAADNKAGLFQVELPLREFENRIEARDEKTGETVAITVYRVKHFAGGYRLSIDDNIWFLRDIYQHAGEYGSIFDNPYLAFLRQVHETYGTKVHINLFYQTDGFNLSLLSDEFRGEWKAQADWIRLSFHALGEFPDMPYKESGYEEVERDCALVMKEILRFAGPEVMGPITTVHWGELTREGARAIRDAGYKGLLGYFNVDDDLPAVSFYLDKQQRRHMKKRWIWKDNAMDMVFIRSSIVIDKKELSEIRSYLDAYELRGNKPPYADLLVHEQYYYPFYEAYQPDFRERIITAVEWARDNGYRPAFLSEAIFEQ